MGTRIIAFILASLFLISSMGFSLYLLFSGQTGTSNQPLTSEQRQERDQAVEQLAQQGIYQPTAEEIDQAVEALKDLVGQDDADQPQLIADFSPRSDRVSQLEITDTIEGDGAEVQPGDTVTVHYTGALVSDGTIFDSSHPGDPVTFGLAALIEAWQIGIPGMKVGGKRRLVVPAAQAYGDTGQGSIPIDADLVFDIELIGISN